MYWWQWPDTRRVNQWEGVMLRLLAVFALLLNHSALAQDGPSMSETTKFIQNRIDSCTHNYQGAISFSLANQNINITNNRITLTNEVHAHATRSFNNERIGKQDATYIAQLSQLSSNVSYTINNGCMTLVISCLQSKCVNRTSECTGIMKCANQENVKSLILVVMPNSGHKLQKAFSHLVSLGGGKKDLF